MFKDRDDHAWVNPYKQEAWDYLTEIALEAKKLGFDEIQFDYVRFCTEKACRTQSLMRKIRRDAAGQISFWSYGIRVREAER